MKNFKNIPSVDELLSQALIKEFIEKYNRDFILGLIRQALVDFRRQMPNQDISYSRDEITQLLLKRVVNLAEVKTAGTLRKVINATGVVLHTNMGRAPLGEQATDYLVEMARSYNNLEYNLQKGSRGSRYDHVEELLVELTGAQAALVVNNNAAAVMLGLNTIAKDKEVIVSRGQLVEIGGAFRIPEVMKLSGAKLIEVGTTNKTYLSDYATAINENTGLLFSAHTSNYKIVGFTEEVKMAKLVDLGHQHGLPVMQDLGSGVLYDLKQVGLTDEPTVQASIASGVDILTFSGDKLLGGPQAGIIVGQKQYIEAMKENQLTRALRVGKLTIAALEGTLIEYLSGKPERKIPTLAMLSQELEELNKKAVELRDKLKTELDNNEFVSEIDLISLEDMVGGGAYPIHKIEGVGVELKFRDLNLEKLLARLRLKQPALVTRVQADSMLISVRTLLNGDIELIPGLIKNALMS